jgi:hypothetical protein
MQFVAGRQAGSSEEGSQCRGAQSGNASTGASGVCGSSVMFTPGVCNSVHAS